MSHAASPGHDCAARCPLASAGRPQDGFPQAPGVDRRTFLSQAMLASAYAAAAAALAACGSGGTGDNATAPPSISSNVITVASYPALANVGGVQTVTYNGSPLAIVRTGTASFLALSLVCPHQGTTLDVTSSGFHCPNHGATFNSTGAWVGGQRTSSMSSLPATYDAAAGTLTIG
ncbi:MAG TPA: Rieske (2Fe-2S) protein [Gemmatirosa sp.]